jgi:hypothetical protein
MAAAAFPRSVAKIAVLVRLENIVQRAEPLTQRGLTWHVKLWLVRRLSELVYY